MDRENDILYFPFYFFWLNFEIDVLNFKDVLVNEIGFDENKIYLEWILSLWIGIENEEIKFYGDGWEVVGFSC